jgi:hypothetical protein
VCGSLSTFQNRRYGRLGPVDWPERSPDLTPVEFLSDFFFEGGGDVWEEG